MKLLTNKASGTLRKIGDTWTIELKDSGLGDMRLESDSIEMPVRLLFWADHEENGLPEIEAIAERQQLDISIVAHGLGAEGALSEEREEFLKRLRIPK